MSRTAISAAPCAKCPFRKDVPIYLTRERRAEIAHAVGVEDQVFWCHETTEYDDETEDMEAVGSSTMCAGAAKAVMLSGGTTNYMRVMERIGLADLDKTEDRGAEVWDLSTWVELAEGATGDNPEIDEEIGETCHCVEDGCLAPAGFLGGGGAVVQGTVYVDGYCEGCGEATCDACLDEGGHCACCRDEYDEEW